MLAEKLGAEVGYSRARVMNGGVDAEKVIGISGHLLAPGVYCCWRFWRSSVNGGRTQ